MVNHVSTATPQETKPNIGVSRQNRRELADRLAEALADTYLLYLKTQGFHWNVVGPLFYGLHKLTEQQYEDMAKAVDVIAERIRAIGFTAPGSFRQFSELASIEEETGTPDAENMIRQLVRDNESCARRLRDSVIAAEQVEDVQTVDLLTHRIGKHEENAWMLRSILAE